MLIKAGEENRYWVDCHSSFGGTRGSWHCQRAHGRRNSVPTGRKHSAGPGKPQPAPCDGSGDHASDVRLRGLGTRKVPLLSQPARFSLLPLLPYSLPSFTSCPSPCRKRRIGVPRKTRGRLSGKRQVEGWGGAALLGARWRTQVVMGSEFPRGAGRGDHRRRHQLL